MRNTRRIPSVILSLTLLVAVSCAPAGTAGSSLVVVTSTSILGDVVRSVVGDDASVEVLMPVGADPHSFSPSAQQVAAMNEADLVVVNGLGLEEPFEDILTQLEADGVVVLEVGPMVDPIPFDAAGDEGQEHEGEDGHEGSDDPHIWMDPMRMAEAARFIAAELDAIEASANWSERAEAYAEDLSDAADEIEGLLSGIDESARVLVTNHDSLGYFADRFGFEIVGTVLPGGSTLGDPSSDALAALVMTMRDHGVSVIFGETTHPSTLAEAVAAELGADVSVVELYTGSLGAPGSGADTLIGMLLTDAMLIAGALGPGS